MGGLDPRSTPKAEHRSLVTHGFIRSWEPLWVITKRIPGPKVRLLVGGAFAVVSDWDESLPVSKSTAFYEIRNWGG